MNSKALKGSHDEARRSSFFPYLQTRSTALCTEGEIVKNEGTIWSISRQHTIKSSQGPFQSQTHKSQKPPHFPEFGDVAQLGDHHKTPRLKPLPNSEV